MFMGPFDQPIAWSTDNMIGSRRFLERVWKLADKVEMKKKPAAKSTEASSDLAAVLNKTIQKIGNDIESMSFNTAVSSMMILLNEMEKSYSHSEKRL